MIGREYIPTFFLLTLEAILFVWYQFFERPRMKREREEAKRNELTAAPESHSKSSE